DALYPWLSVLDNVQLHLHLQGKRINKVRKSQSPAHRSQNGKSLA
ncbi:hypothetical protein AAUPMC_13196, partial [Pasteurella multocida subsp. multocida str. Anand1_cattle]